MGYGKPGWLEALYTHKFFEKCPAHESAKKNEMNVLCLDCCTSLCPHCIPVHRFHRLIQIRRYVYHEVIRLEDLDKVFDCSLVQAYSTNSAKVIFIKKRPQNRRFKEAENYCTSCDRSLQEPYIHCSLGCKVDFVMAHNGDVTPYLRRCKVLQLSPDYFCPQDSVHMAEVEMTNETTTNSTVVDCDEEAMSSSCSGSSGFESMSISCNNNHIVRKKRNGLYVCATSVNKISDQDMASNLISNRRKGVPHRSPLC